MNTFFSPKLFNKYFRIAFASSPLAIKCVFGKTQAIIVPVETKVFINSKNTPSNDICPTFKIALLPLISSIAEYNIFFLSTQLIPATNGGFIKIISIVLKNFLSKFAIFLLYILGEFSLLIIFAYFNPNLKESNSNNFIFTSFTIIWLGFKEKISIAELIKFPLPAAGSQIILSFLSVIDFASTDTNLPNSKSVGTSP